MRPADAHPNIRCDLDRDHILASSVTRPCNPPEVITLSFFFKLASIVWCCFSRCCCGRMRRK